MKNKNLTDIEQRIQDETFDLNPEEIRQLGYQVTDLIVDYFKKIDNPPIIPTNNFKELRKLIEEPLPQNEQKPNNILEECKEKVIDNAIRIGHPRFLGWILPSGTIIGAFADGLAGALNQNVVLSRAGASTAVELLVIDWIKEILGYEPDAGGILVSGGTTANLNALNIARNIKSDFDLQKQGMKNEKDMVLYASEEVHVCIPKAASILGIGTNNIHWVKVDDNSCLDTKDLENKIIEDQKNNKHPFLVVATAGTVNSGAIDPLNDIADICQKYNLWFHVDAAYGGFAVLSSNLKPLFQGISRADSIALDPHKWLYIPYEAGCILVKDPSHMKQTFATRASYIQRDKDHSDVDEIDFSDYGIQLSRGFRALKIWMSLKQYGIKKYERLVNQNVDLAKYMEELVKNSDDFEVMTPVVLSIFCFRYFPQDLQNQFNESNHNNREKIEKYLDSLNNAIIGNMLTDQRAIIYSTNIRNRFVLRACIVNYRTKKHDIENIIEVIKELGDKADNQLRSSCF
jgi:glutamate/tyrosine decarboxylase-like PLP-dependent enzyme